MDKSRWENQRSRPLRGFNISVTAEFVNSEYDYPQFADEAVTGESGLLVLMRIDPRNPELPSFRIRWDHKEDSVNVDLVGDDPEESRKFASGHLGYFGHKTLRVQDNPRIQTIDIKTPVSGDVFRGSVIFNLVTRERRNFSANAVLVYEKKSGV